MKPGCCEHLSPCTELIQPGPFWLRTFVTPCFVTREPASAPFAMANLLNVLSTDKMQMIVAKLLASGCHDPFTKHMLAHEQGYLTET